MEQTVVGIVIAVAVIALGLFASKWLDRVSERAAPTRPSQRDQARSSTVVPSSGARPSATTTEPLPARPQRLTSVAPAPAVPATHVDGEQDDRLFARYHEVDDLLRAAVAAINALPATFTDRDAMRAYALILEQSLRAVHQSLSATHPAQQVVLSNQLEKLARQLTSLRGNAQGLAASDAAYRQLVETVGKRATLLQHDLDAALRQQPYRLILPDARPIATATLQLAPRLPEPDSVGSHDDLKRQIGRARGLLSDIAANQHAIAAARARRDEIIALLASPELAEKPEWHRGIAVLRQRAPTDADIIALATDADALVQRRHALIGGLEPDGIGGYLLHEDRLSRIIDDASALQRDIRTLWQQARAVVRHGMTTSASARTAQR